MLSNKTSHKAKVCIGACWLRHGLGIIIVLAVFLSHKGRISGDGQVRWEALATLIQEGRLTPDKYSIVQPLLASPLYLLGLVLDGSTDSNHDENRSIKRAVGRFNQCTTLILLASCLFILRRWADFTTKEITGATFFLLFGTLLLPHSRDFYSEPLWTALSVLAIGGLVALDEPNLVVKTSTIRLGVIICIALTIPLNPLLAPVWIATQIFSSVWLALNVVKNGSKLYLASILKSGNSLIVVFGVLAGFCLMAFENLIRRGNAFSFGYPGEGFSTDFWYGVFGQFFAPARGVVFFIPAFILGVWIFKRKTWLQCSLPMKRFLSFGYLFCTLIVLAYAKWHAWHGAWYWGPRFLLPLSVFGSIAFVQLFKTQNTSNVFKVALFTVGIMSVMVQQVGFAIGHEPLMECLKEDPLNDNCYWQWSYSPVASWFNKEHIAEIASNRTIPVMITASFLLILWDRSRRKAITIKSL